MRRDKVIELLQTLPENAEIVVSGYHCDILGEYMYNADFGVDEVTAYGKGLHRAFCSHRFKEDEPRIVYVLE